MEVKKSNKQKNKIKAMILWDGNKKRLFKWKMKIFSLMKIRLLIRNILWVISHKLTKQKLRKCNFLLPKKLINLLFIMKWKIKLLKESQNKCKKKLYNNYNKKMLLCNKNNKKGKLFNKYKQKTNCINNKLMRVKWKMKIN